MAGEIAALRPDVACLQEVDRWDEVKEDLARLG
jgi:hypothetical protein